MSGDLRNVFLILIFAAVFSAAQATLGLIRVGHTKHKVNRRLVTAGRTKSIGELVVELRKQRGLNQAGDPRLRWPWLAGQIMRSGLTYRPRQWFLVLAASAAVVSAAAYALTRIPWALAVGPPAIVGLAIMVLKVLAARRAKALGEQLPNALEIIVRSLEAGHPVPTAISLVGREMGDPIGGEFGMTSDEIAYGATMEQAVGRMADRCQHPDVDLFAATIRLQERVGGNLTALLKLNAKTVRERHKMRLRIKAASSEGRASAMILTSAPFIVVGLLALASPGYYGELLHEPVIRAWLAGFGAWMFVGNLVMRRMINLRI